MPNALDIFQILTKNMFAYLNRCLTKRNLTQVDPVDAELLLVFLKTNCMNKTVEALEAEYKEQLRTLGGVDLDILNADERHQLTRYFNAMVDVCRA